MIGVIKGTMRQKKEVNGLPLPIASYKANMKTPIRNLKVAITAKQSGSGAPYPAGGGYNKWDEEWENGTFNTTTGANINNTIVNVQIRSKNFIPILPNVQYCFIVPNGAGWFIFFDTDGNVINNPNVTRSSGTSVSGNSVAINNGVIFTVNEPNVRYTRFYMTYTYPSTYNHDIAINYPSSVTTYSPYSNIRPISGWSECNVCNTPMPVSQLWTIDSSFNGVVNFNQLIQTKAAQTYQVSGLTITFDGNGKVKVENTASASVNIPITSNYPTYIEGHKYFIKGCPSGGSNSTYSLRYNSNGFGENGNGSILTAVTSGAANRNILVGSDYPAISIANGTSVNKTFEPILIDLTQKFGSTIADYIYSLEQGTAGAGVAFFRSIYPNDYYAYDTGTDEMVGSREGNTYTIQLGDTYYGGELDVTNGVLRVTHEIVDLGDLNWLYQSGNGTYFYAPLSTMKPVPNSTTLGNALCEQYAIVTARDFVNSPYPNNTFAVNNSSSYPILIRNTSYTDATAFKTAISGVQLVYPLATPITVQLTPTQIEQLLGTNNVFADTGDVEELKYIDRQVYYGR